MMYECIKETLYIGANGIRRTEIRYSGELSSSGKLIIKRCVGKSFLEKSKTICTGIPEEIKVEKSA